MQASTIVVPVFQQIRGKICIKFSLIITGKLLNK